MSEAKDESRELGSRWLWFLSRLVPFTPSVMLPHLGLVRGILFQFVMLVMLMMFWLPRYTLAYGDADESGISFRRFIRRYRVSWNDVERVNWNPNWASFLIVFEHRIGGSQAARFDSFRMRSRRQGARPEDEVPEIVLWVAGQIKLHEAFPASK